GRGRLIGCEGRGAEGEERTERSGLRASLFALSASHSFSGRLGGEIRRGRGPPSQLRRVSGARGTAFWSSSSPLGCMQFLVCSSIRRGCLRQEPTASVKVAIGRRGRARAEGQGRGQ